MSKPQTIAISSNGTITAIYSDDLAGLMAAGESNIRRASHVEPGADGMWYADMSPALTVLGLTLTNESYILGPYRLRQEALDAEVEWLNGHIFV